MSKRFIPNLQERLKHASEAKKSMLDVKCISGTRSDSRRLIERSVLVSGVSGRDHLLLRHRDRIKECLHWGFAKAPAALMWPRLIVFANPQIEIVLQLVD